MYGVRSMVCGALIHPSVPLHRLPQEQSGTLSKYFQHTIGALLQVSNDCPGRM